MEATLQVVAEISIGFTGFAGIVGALGGSKLKPDHPSVWLCFWSMVELGLMTLIAALFPALPQEFGAADRLTWSMSSGVLALFVAGHLLFMWPRFIRARRAGSLVPFPTLNGIMAGALIAALVTQALNAIGVGFSQPSAGFLLGLYLLLVVSGLNFAYLMYVVVSPGPRAA
jgi:hypothetical protein